MTEPEQWAVELLEAVISHLFVEVRDGETEAEATKRTTMQVCRDASTAAITALDAHRGKQACLKARENSDG